MAVKRDYYEVLGVSRDASRDEIRKAWRDAANGACIVRLSDDTFTAGLAAQKHLLRGLFTADGTVVGSSVVLTT